MSRKRSRRPRSAPPNGAARRASAAPPVVEEVPRRPARLRPFLGRHLRVTVAGVILALGVAGYLVFIPFTVYNTGMLSALVPHAPVLPHLTKTPAFNGAIPIVPISVPAVTTAAANDPGHTAAYSIQWFGTGSEGANEQVTVYLLPNTKVAGSLASYERSQNISTSALAAAKYTLKKRYSDSATGASGVAYTIPRKAQNSAGQEITVGVTPGFSVIAQHGRAVAREIAQGPGVTEAESLAIARQVDGVLASRLPTFPTIASTRYPFLASLIYILVTVALFAVALVAPALARRRAVARRIHDAERARYQYRVRGAKNLRRHRAPY